MLIVRAR